MVCRNCGKEVVDDTRFCPYCGENADGISDELTGEREAQQAPNSLAKEILIVTWVIAACLGVVALFMFFAFGPSSGSTSRSAGRLSESTQRKIFYDITATQDQNPYSTEWGEDAKQAAADHYGVPRSTISDIILEGATEGWLLPDPP